MLRLSVFKMACFMADGSRCSLAGAALANIYRGLNTFSPRRISWPFVYAWLAQQFGVHEADSNSGDKPLMMLYRNPELVLVEPGLFMRTRSSEDPLAEPDPELERSLLQLRRRENSAMEDQHEEEGAEKTMKHYVTSNPNAQRSTIVRPEVPNKFEIKPQTLSMIQNSYQFGDLSNDDPNEHIERFLELCDTFKFEDVTNEAVWLRLFPFTLRDRAKSWLSTLPLDSIRTWDELQMKFLGKYFPPAKTIKLRNAISNFMLEHDEQLFEAWERYKELLRKCPNHGIPRWMQMEIFYNGITVLTRSLIDVAAGGTMNKKTPNEVYELIEEMTSNTYQYPVERSARGRVSAVHNVDHVLALQAQVESLTKQMKKLHTPSLVAQICDMCGGGHPNHECQAGRNQGTLPRNSETNPNEQIKAITLRSGKVLEEQKQPQVEKDKAINSKTRKERSKMREKR
ncbi:hypothetical protein H6P81_006463 [Aristolochia fimbriata]|uniref:Retrotransposon gag domain-containing protein n=1 Tax=Aristolochia fimbriata TaxID=158543 RepID=A0AAV7EYJ4_ARIFI|nr:hypothetical protein H6P81_006463 [Aristolochia fimbriata]